MEETLGLTLNSFEDRLAGIKAQSERYFNEIAPTIRAKYPQIELSRYEITQIDSAEKENSICNKCSGLPCVKKYNKCLENIVNFDEEQKKITFAVRQCRYEIERKREAKNRKLFKASGIPDIYKGKNFDNYSVDDKNRNAVKAAKYIIENPSQGAYFFGSFGTGKTFLAAIIAQELLKRGHQVLFASMPEISTAIRSAFSNQNIAEDKIYQTLYDVDTLILDDVGVEKPTKFICEVLSKIINYRYNSRKQFIITSNYSPEEIRDIYNNPTDSFQSYDGSRIYDRCKQVCQSVELLGESRR